MELWLKGLFTTVYLFAYKEYSAWRQFYGQSKSPTFAAAKDTVKTIGWERFDFNKDAPLDDEEIEG